MKKHQKILFGILMALIAALLQLVFWDFLKPLIWILFYPAVFFAASYGGLMSGLSAGAATLVLVFFVFLEPTFTFSMEKVIQMQTAIVFLPVAYLIGNLQEKYQRLRSKLHEDLELSEKDRIQISKLYEKSLIIEDIKFSDFANSLPQIVWATDAAGKNIYFNDAWMDYTGMSLAESLGDGWNKPFHPEDQGKAWEAWKNATENLAEYALECRLKKKDGSYHWWLIRGVPVIDHFGKITRWFGTCTDIDQIKQTMDDLAKEKATLQSIFENNPDGMAIVRTDGTYAAFNENYLSYFGVAHEIPFTDTYYQLMSKFDVTTLRGEIITEENIPELKALSGELVLAKEIHLKHKTTGRQWYGSHSAGPIRDNANNITGAIVTVRDVSLNIEHQSQLLETVKEQDSILNSEVVGICKTKARKFLWVNDCFANYFGYSQDELLGQSTEILYPDVASYENFGKTIASASLQDNKMVKDTISLKRKDGSLGQFLVGGGALSEHSDESIWMSLDVTQDRKNRALLQAYLARLEKSMEETLLVLSKAIEMRDPYTAGHQYRVGEIAKSIGIKMGLPSETANNLRLMGLIHDIGKIGVPAEILNKPGKLSEEELNLVKSHTKIGYDILKQVNFDIPIAEIAYQHHERMDGTGYPQGLESSSILLESKIIAVADVIEAMTNRRPYRSPLGIEQALEEVENGRGTKYDAEVVDACLKLFKEDGYTIENEGH
jgi:PAS domain S-box-containing protein